MLNLAIDASVAVKWLSDQEEEYIDQANKLLEDILGEEIIVYMPQLSKYEIANALLKKKKLSLEEAKIPLATFYSLPINFVEETQELAIVSYKLAEKLNITYYDACYLAITDEFKSTLITDNVKHQGKISDIRVIPLSDYK